MGALTTGEWVLLEQVTWASYSPSSQPAALTVVGMRPPGGPDWGSAGGLVTPCPTAVQLLKARRGCAVCHWYGIPAPCAFLVNIRSRQCGTARDRTLLKSAMGPPSLGLPFILCVVPPRPVPFMQWALPVSFQESNPLMLSHMFDLQSFDGFQGW